jgi:hypothetical protein
MLNSRYKTPVEVANVELLMLNSERSCECKTPDAELRDLSFINLYSIF